MPPALPLLLPTSLATSAGTAAIAYSAGKDYIEDQKDDGGGGGGGSSSAPKIVIPPPPPPPTPVAQANVSSQQAGRKARLAKFRPTAGRASTIATSPQGAIGDVKRRALIGAPPKAQGTILGAI